MQLFNAMLFHTGSSINIYIHTYHFVGPQILSYNSQTWNLSKKKKTQYNTIQYN